MYGRKNFFNIRIHTARNCFSHVFITYLEKEMTAWNQPESSFKKIWSSWIGSAEMHRKQPARWKKVEYKSIFHVVNNLYVDIAKPNSSFSRNRTTLSSVWSHTFSFFHLVLRKICSYFQLLHALLCVFAVTNFFPLSDEENMMDIKKLFKKKVTDNMFPWCIINLD